MGAGNSSEKRNITITERGESPEIQILPDLEKRLREEVLNVEPKSSKTSASSKVSWSPELEMDEEETNRLRSEVDYWKDKYEVAQSQNVEQTQLEQDKFNEAVQEVEAKFAGMAYSPVCLDCQDQVVKCYLENGATTLNCSNLVAQFSQCVEKARADVLTIKGVAAS